MKRREFLVSSAALTASAALPGQALSQDRRKELLIVANETGPNSLDIHTVGANRPSYGVSWICYDRLMTFGKKKGPNGVTMYDYTKLEPEIAESWQPASDGTSVTFKLRKNAKFHDGTPVTAKDVKWSFDRMVTVGGFPTFQMKAGSFEKPEQFVVVDDHTFRVKFVRKDKLSMPDMAVPVPVVINATLAKKHATEQDPWALTWLRNNEAGGGAYRIEAWRPGDVVVLNDAPFPTGDAGPALQRFVEAGGGLLWAMGPRAGAVPAPLRPVLGTVGARPVDRLSSHGGALGVADYEHPIFAPYRDARGGDYGAVRVYRYRRLSPPPPDSARVLAWMDDGSPILTEHRLGVGRVVVWGSDFGNVWNNLPVRAVFLPTVHETIRHLARHREPPPSYDAGQVLDLKTVERPGSAELVLQAPDGSRTPVPSDTARLLALPAAGFYTLRPLAGGGGTGIPIAVNLDPTESDLSQLDRSAFVAAVSGEGENGRPARTPAGLNLAERERRQRLWWYLALAALLVLAAESQLAGVRPRGIGA